MMILSIARSVELITVAIRASTARSSENRARARPKEGELAGARDIRIRTRGCRVAHGGGDVRGAPFTDRRRFPGRPFAQSGEDVGFAESRPVTANDAPAASSGRTRLRTARAETAPPEGSRPEDKQYRGREQHKPRSAARGSVRRTLHRPWWGPRSARASKLAPAATDGWSHRREGGDPCSPAERTSRRSCRRRPILMERDPSGFLAVTIFEGLRKTIWHTDAHARAPQRSNIAHELAHALLFHAPGSDADPLRARPWDRTAEDEAQWLGGAQLVSDEAAFALAYAGTDQVDAARQYGVSTEMLTFRLNVTRARVHAARSQQRRQGH
jgi:hypothetical protein